MDDEPYLFLELDLETRGFMADELRVDVETGAGPYIATKTLTARGQEDYPDLLRAAITSGDEMALVASLDEGDRALSSPVDATLRLGRTEFNRYYIRGICLRAGAHGTNTVVVYRAHASYVPRESSMTILGQQQFAPRILENLRGIGGVDPDTKLGLVNSGISIRCGCTPCVGAQP